jgi:hypothetical protein
LTANRFEKISPEKNTEDKEKIVPKSDALQGLDEDDALATERITSLLWSRAATQVA